MTDTPSDDDGLVPVHFILNRGPLSAHELQEFLDAVAKITGTLSEKIKVEGQLTPVTGVVTRAVDNDLNYVALDDNPSGKRQGLLARGNCVNPPPGYLKDQASVFRAGDKVEGFVDPLGTDQILNAKVTPVRGRKPGL